jgi:predicted double-glycine peptidase
MPEAQFESRKRSPLLKPRIYVPIALVIVLCAGGTGALMLWDPAPHLNQLPIIRQGTPYTCGVAVLQSILFYYGEEWREDNLAKELKSTPEDGTDYHEIIRFARSKGLTVETAENMTLEDLRRAVDADHPVVVAFQAWGDHPENYAAAWEDGHYSIVIGVDNNNVYLMDPSTIGNYTFVPIPEFLARWHDYYMEKDGRRVNLVHFGMIFGSRSKPAYKPGNLAPLR